MGFVQVRLDVVAINISNMAAFVRAGQTSLNVSSYYLTLSKAKQRFRADGMLMPHLLQSPNVVGNTMRHLTLKSCTLTLETDLIFSQPISGFVTKLHYIQR